MSKLLEEILSDENIKQAFKKVASNKGAAGIDGIQIKEAKEALQQNWNNIKNDIQNRKYKPMPVLRVEIPKPNGGTRKLGIPTVIDRVIEQAITQKLVPLCEPHFHENSYGFRPNKSAQQAVLKLKDFVNDGYMYLVDLDLEKFFDNVNQDKLMSLIHNIINDPDTESLICKYLKAGVMVNGKLEPTTIGTPQGGNLSPLLSNIMLNELDKELTKRDLKFVRYADDCIIAVRSKVAAKRVMGNITRWIEKKLYLKVNKEKSKIVCPRQVKYLGFSFWKSRNEYKLTPHKDSKENFKRKLKQLTERRKSMNLKERLKMISSVIRGWVNYFRIGSMKTFLKEVDEHLRTRIRIIIWKMWKTSQKRMWGLTKIGVPKWMARKSVAFGDHYQAVAKTTGLHKITKEILANTGLVSCLDYYLN